MIQIGAEFCGNSHIRQPGRNVRQHERRMNVAVSDDSVACRYKGPKFNDFAPGLPMTASPTLRPMMMMAVALGLAIVVPLLVVMTS